MASQLVGAYRADSPGPFVPAFASFCPSPSPPPLRPPPFPPFSCHELLYQTRLLPFIVSYSEYIGKSLPSPSFAHVYSPTPMYWYFLSRVWRRATFATQQFTSLGESHLMRTIFLALPSIINRRESKWVDANLFRLVDYPIIVVYRSSSCWLVRFFVIPSAITLSHAQECNLSRSSFLVVLASRS